MKLSGSASQDVGEAEIVWDGRRRAAEIYSVLRRTDWLCAGSSQPSSLGANFCNGEAPRMTIELGSLIEWSIKSFVLINIILGGFAYLTLFERRALARMQGRIGPNRAGPAGILQPIADGIKLMFKEELIPDRADKVLFILAPIITVVPVLLLLAVVPLGPDVVIFGQEISLG